MRDAAIDGSRQSRRSGPSRSTTGRQRGDLSSAAVAAERLGAALDRPVGITRSQGRRGAKERRWPVPALFGRFRPVKALTTVAFSAALVAIVANAVLFQKNHQAGTSAEAPSSGAASAPSSAARSIAADAGATASVPPQPAAASAAPPTIAARPAAPAAPHPPRTAGGDAIGALLGGPSPAAEAPAASAARGKSDPLLRRAQRELKKLGYAVTPDGRMDDVTRQAIRRFEHDHHLQGGPVMTSELRHSIAEAASPKTVPEAAPKAR